MTREVLLSHTANDLAVDGLARIEFACDRQIVTGSVQAVNAVPGEPADLGSHISPVLADRHGKIETDNTILIDIIRDRKNVCRNISNILIQGRVIRCLYEY